MKELFILTGDSNRCGFHPALPSPTEFRMQILINKSLPIFRAEISQFPPDTRRSSTFGVTSERGHLLLLHPEQDTNPSLWPGGAAEGQFQLCLPIPG